MKGFRVPPKSTKKEALEKIEKEMANIQMANRISQMMVKQLMENVKSMNSDLNAAITQMYELQYKLNAAVKLSNLDPVALADTANAQRLVDFNEASTRADLKDNMTAVDTVTANSTVTISSTATDAAGNEAGIFRSRIKLSESGAPDLIKGLEGAAVGAKVNCKLNGLDHVVELLAIRDPAAVDANALPEAVQVQ